MCFALAEKKMRGQTARHFKQIKMELITFNYLSRDKLGCGPNNCQNVFRFFLGLISLQRVVVALRSILEFFLLFLSFLLSEIQFTILTFCLCFFFVGFSVMDGE